MGTTCPAIINIELLRSASVIMVRVHVNRYLIAAYDLIFCCFSFRHYNSASNNIEFLLHCYLTIGDIKVFLTRIFIYVIILKLSYFYCKTMSSKLKIFVVFLIVALSLVFYCISIRQKMTNFLIPNLTKLIYSQDSNRVQHRCFPFY